MQTPMHADGSIDYARWEELIDLYIDAGVHGLVLGAGTGQHPYLTQQECNRLYELGAGESTDVASWFARLRRWYWMKSSSAANMPRDSAPMR